MKPKNQAKEIIEKCLQEFLVAWSFMIPHSIWITMSEEERRETEAWVYKITESLLSQITNK